MVLRISLLLLIFILKHVHTAYIYIINSVKLYLFAPSLLLAYPAPSIYVYSFFIPCGVADTKSCKATTPSRSYLYTAAFYSIKIPGMRAIRA